MPPATLVSRAVETAGQVAAFVGRHADAQHLIPCDVSYLQSGPMPTMTAFFTHCYKKINARSNKAQRSGPC
jgi:hypothetical protein